MSDTPPTAEFVGQPLDVCFIPDTEKGRIRGNYIIAEDNNGQSCWIQIKVPDFKGTLEIEVTVEHPTNVLIGKKVKDGKLKITEFVQGTASLENIAVRKFAIPNSKCMIARQLLSRQHDSSVASKIFPSIKNWEEFKMKLQKPKHADILLSANMSLIQLEEQVTEIVKSTSFSTVKLKANIRFHGKGKVMESKIYSEPFKDTKVRRSKRHSGAFDNEKGTAIKKMKLTTALEKDIKCKDSSKGEVQVIERKDFDQQFPSSENDLESPSSSVQQCSGPSGHDPELPSSEKNEQYFRLKPCGLGNAEIFEILTGKFL